MDVESTSLPKGVLPADFFDDHVEGAVAMGMKRKEAEKQLKEYFVFFNSIIYRNEWKEFEKFAKALADTQKKIDDAGKDLDELVGTRTRQMQKQLNKLDELPEEAEGTQE